MWKEALSLFDALDSEGLKPDVDTFTAAIWACDLAGDSARALSLLKLANFNGLKVQTSTYDAALSTLMKTGDWENCLGVFHAMGRENIEPSALSFKVSDIYIYIYIYNVILVLIS